MGSSAAPLLQEAEKRLERDEAFAAVLEAILGAPGRSAGRYRRAAAVALNEQRRRNALDEFRSAALPTSTVQKLLRLRTPQAVHRLRSRGRVIGLHLGNSTWFPAWQFSGGRLREDLPRVLELLGRFSADPVAADRVMRLERAELGGRSIADALEDDGVAPVAWIVLGQLG